MRIKKKHVILEANLIDVTNEFTPQEKRLLFVLNKQYGPHNWRNYDIWDGATFLIELFEIPYDLAYDLSETYYYNGEALFSEAPKLRKRQNSTEVFLRHLGPIIELVYKSRIGENDYIGNIHIDFKNDDYGDYVLDRNISMWTHSRSFTLYMPISVWVVGDYPHERQIKVTERDNRQVMVTVNFNPIKQDPVDGEPSWKEIYSNDEINISVNIEVGEMRGERDKNEFMNFNVPIPKPMTKDSMIELVNSIIDDVLEKIKNTELSLPKGTEPLIIRTH